MRRDGQAQRGGSRGRRPGTGLRSTLELAVLMDRVVRMKGEREESEILLRFLV